LQVGAFLKNRLAGCAIVFLASLFFSSAERGEFVRYAIAYSLSAIIVLPLAWHRCIKRKGKGVPIGILATLLIEVLGQAGIAVYSYGLELGKLFSMFVFNPFTVVLGLPLLIGNAIMFDWWSSET
jgi:hypothetical protein